MAIVPLLLAPLAPKEATCPLTPAQMRGIRVWDQGRTGIDLNPAPGMVRIVYHASFKNETPRELASLRIKLLIDLGGRRAYESPERSLTRFASLSVPVKGPIAPMNKTEYVENIAFDIPARYWRDGLFDRIVVTGGTTFVNPDLHDAGHLYTRLMNGKDEEEIEMLKRAPSLLRVRNAQGFDITLMAFATCGPKMIRYALAHGGSAKARTVSGATIMHLAALNPYPGVLDLALKLGGDVNGRTRNGKTPLLRAIVYGTPITQNWLLAHGANPRYEAGPGYTAAQYAIHEGQIPALGALVKAGLSPRSKDSLGQGWYHYAVFNYMMMDTVRSFGVPIDDPNPKTGATPLMTAAWSGYTEPRVWLLQHGANPKLKDKWGRTAYDYAMHVGDNDWAWHNAPRLSGSAYGRRYFAELVGKYAKAR